MKRILVYTTVFISILIALQSCSTSNLGIAKDMSLLQQTWKHSYEEATTDGSDIYRPANYKTFTPSMFRQVYDLKADEKCEYLVLHPADAHYMAKGTWAYNNTSHILEIKDAQYKAVVKFQVVELGQNILRIRKF